MDWDRRTHEIIEAAERALAELAVKAAAERDYPRATALLETAQRVSEAARLNGKVASAKQVDRTPVHGAPTRNNDDDVLSTESEVAAPPMRPAKKPKPQYPRFRREDTTLVKIGYSKSERATYEHRSPRNVLDRLIERIAEVGARGERFTTEQLMPLQDARGSELPSYQVYLCLAWLVSQGLIERHGRQGYTVADTTALPSAVDQAWSSLSKR